jgi:hypothetical protein
MQERTDLNSDRKFRDAVVRTFLKGVSGAVAVFVLAAIVAPWLFDSRENVKVATAFGLWLVCPLLVFLIGFDIFVDLKRHGRPRT